MDDTLRLKDNKIRELEDSVARMGYENEKAREQVERHKRRLSDLINQQAQLANSSSHCTESERTVSLPLPSSFKSSIFF